MDALCCDVVTVYLHYLVVSEATICTAQRAAIVERKLRSVLLSSHASMVVLNLKLWR